MFDVLYTWEERIGNCSGCCGGPTCPACNPALGRGKPCDPTGTSCPPDGTVTLTVSSVHTSVNGPDPNDPNYREKTCEVVGEVYTIPVAWDTAGCRYVGSLALAPYFVGYDFDCSPTYFDRVPAGVEVYFFEASPGVWVAKVTGGVTVAGGYAGFDVFCAFDGYCSEVGIVFPCAGSDPDPTWPVTCGPDGLISFGFNFKLVGGGLLGCGSITGPCPPFTPGISTAPCFTISGTFTAGGPP